MIFFFGHRLRAGVGVEPDWVSANSPLIVSNNLSFSSNIFQDSTTGWPLELSHFETSFCTWHFNLNQNIARFLLTTGLAV